MEDVRGVTPREKGIYRMLETKTTKRDLAKLKWCRTPEEAEATAAAAGVDEFSVEAHDAYDWDLGYSIPWYRAIPTRKKLLGRSK